MIKKTLFALLALMPLYACAPAYAQEAYPTVVFSEQGASVTRLNEKQVALTGLTTIAQVQAATSEFRRSPFEEIKMFGRGGEFYAAFVMFKFFQGPGSAVKVIVPEGISCISSCAFIAISAPELQLDGELWFHPPFLPVVSGDRTLLELMQIGGVGAIDSAFLLREGGLPWPYINFLYHSTDVNNYSVLDRERLDYLRANPDIPMVPLVERRKFKIRQVPG